MNCKKFLQVHLKFLLVCYSARMINSAQLFNMRPGKRLNAVAVVVKEKVIREHCMGMCFLHDLCKSFNAYQREGVHVCEIFDKNRCDLETKLIDEPGTSYMDLVAEGQCQSKKLIIFSVCINTILHQSSVFSAKSSIGAFNPIGFWRHLFILWWIFSYCIYLIFTQNIWCNIALTGVKLSGSRDGNLCLDLCMNSQPHTILHENRYDHASLRNFLGMLAVLILKAARIRPGWGQLSTQFIVV